jgi:hypothetical protein
MSFGESVFLAGCNQETAKGGLFIKGNHVISQHNQRGKTLETSRRLSTEDRAKSLIVGAGRPHLYAGRPMGPTNQSLLRTSVSHCLRDHIYAIYSSRFDPRVQN